MLSHDLARALLARRNNDVRIEVLIDDDPAGERGYLVRRVGLRDDLRGSAQIPAGDVITYDTADDVIVVRAGCVVVGEAPDA